MTEQRWKWDIETGALLIGVDRYALKPCSRREVDELAGILRERGEAWLTLTLARKAFVGGTAVYDNCLENVQNLNAGCNAAEQLVKNALAEVEGYVENGAGLFGKVETQNAQMALAMEIIDCLAKNAKD